MGHHIRIAALLGLAAALPLTADAAESYDNCTGFITALPATISTQGVWCLKQNLSTSINSGAAITIAANNVTIDCNDFKIGGLAAGPESWATGIFAEDRQNITVRQCSIRGFLLGIELGGTGGGHLVVDNRLDQNLFTGIYVGGENNRVQRNAVYDTGGHPAHQGAIGINASADVIDNTVAGVFAGAPQTISVMGISVNANGHEARGNRVRGLVPADGTATGMQANAFGVTFADNRVSAEDVGTEGVGIWANGGFCIGNTVLNYSAAYGTCYQSIGNLTLPAEQL